MAKAQNHPDPTRSDGTEAAAITHIRGSSLLLIGRLIGIGLNFTIQIIIVRQLAKADYGAFAYAFAFMSFGSQIVSVGLDKSLTRFVPIYQERREFEKMAGTIVLVLGTILACGAAFVALIYGLRGVIGEHVAPDPLALSLLLIFVFMTPVQALDNLTVSLFANFASPRAVFFRRYVLTPGLKLVAVLALVFFQGGAVFLTVAYLTASILGVAISLVVIAGVLRDQDLLRHFRRGGFRIPIRRVVRFGIPLLSSDLVHALRGTMVVVFLGFFHSSISVAAFRAVLPVARLNTAVLDSFRLLFVPAAGRLYARGDWEGINQLYWRTSSWIVVFTFPIFAISFAFSEPLTLLLFGERYGDSAIVLRVLSVGIFVNATFGFNVRTLQIFDKVRTILRIDLTVIVVAIVLNVVLIREFGALGGAAASCSVLILQNALYQTALFRTRAIDRIDGRFLKVLFTVLVATASLFAIQLIFSPPILLAVVATAIAGLCVVWISIPLLDVAAVFPEIRRFAAVRWLLSIRALER